MSGLIDLLKTLENKWTGSRTLKRNEFLVTAGQIHTDVYWIDEGSLRIYILDDEEEYIIRFGYKNSMIMSLDSFLNGKPSRFYIQAIKKCRLKVISKEDFMHFMNSSDALRRIWEKTLEDFVLQQMEREIDLITFSPQKRFERVFKRSPHLFQEIPQKHIASYLRMTPETLSRILKNLDSNQ